jgi:hypothetical protein
MCAAPVLKYKIAVTTVAQGALLGAWTLVPAVAATVDTPAAPAKIELEMIKDIGDSIFDNVGDLQHPALGVSREKFRVESLRHLRVVGLESTDPYTVLLNGFPFIPAVTAVELADGIQRPH